jgi:hypothetical protein
VGSLIRGFQRAVVRKDQPIRPAAIDILACVLAVVGVGACTARVPAAPPRETAANAAGGPSESDYLEPPTLATAAPRHGGGFLLTGRAGAGDRVMLATPSGGAIAAVTGPDGLWRINLPMSATPRLFSLSEIRRGRKLLSDAYIVVTPRGVVAELRSGAGAFVRPGPGARPAILAVDFDSKGGAVVSGRAAPRATVELSVDGVRRGGGAAEVDGAFSFALDAPLSFANHRFELADGARRAVAQIPLSPAPLPAGAAYRVVAIPGGWRIDWTTPAGGPQATVLMDADRGAS